MTPIIHIITYDLKTQDPITLRKEQSTCQIRFFEKQRITIDNTLYEVFDVEYTITGGEYITTVRVNVKDYWG